MGFLYYGGMWVLGEWSSRKNNIYGELPKKGGDGGGGGGGVGGRGGGVGTPMHTVPYAFIQNLQQLLMQALRVFFWMWITWKISTIILFEINMTEKDKFLFLYRIFTPLMTPICKRKNK